MITKTQISSKLDKVPIEEIAGQTGFSLHKDNEISARELLLSFFIMVSKGGNTLCQWTTELSIVLGRVFCIGALRTKLQFRQEDFSRQLLNHVLRSQLYQSTVYGLNSGLFTAFTKVYLEDSMCVNLPANLSGVYPGAHSNTGQASTARIQCRVELKSGTTSHLEVQSYRDNDQKFASHILHSLEAGALVIRDLGYYALWVFRLIAWQNAFFLSRYRFNTNIYDAQDLTQLDLIQILEEADKNGQNYIDRNIFLGKEEQLPVRLVAIKAPQNVVQQRRRKASKDRSQKANHSKKYMEFLGWTIFITNVEASIWTPEQILKVYGFRWRIEIIFKCWKSQFRFAALFHGKQSLAPSRATITLYFLLVWITLFFVHLFNFFLSEVYRRKQRFVSLLKFAKFFKDHFSELLQASDSDFYLDLVAKLFVYDKKKKIPNFYENLYVLNFNAR